MYSYVWNDVTLEYDLYLDGVIIDSFKTEKGVKLYIHTMTKSE